MICPHASSGGVALASASRSAMQRPMDRSSCRAKTTVQNGRPVCWRRTASTTRSSACEKSSRATAEGASGQGRGRSRGAQGLQTITLPLDFSIHLRLMIVIPRQRRIDLRQLTVRMVLLDGFGAPPVRQMIQNNLHDFDVGIVHPRAALPVQPNVRHRRRAWHGRNLVWRRLPAQGAHPVSERPPSPRAQNWRCTDFNFNLKFMP
jgi:hypothetical protein